jgi:hypothetical protein
MASCHASSIIRLNSREVDVYYGQPGLSAWSCSENASEVLIPRAINCQASTATIRHPRAGGDPWFVRYL